MQCAYMYTCCTVGTCTCQVAHFERFERDIAEAVARGGTTQPSAPELQRWCAFAGPSPGPIPLALALTPVGTDPSPHSGRELVHSRVAE